MTSKYFRGFDIVNYNFGDNEARVFTQDLSQYVDLIDQIKDSTSFYNKYTVVSGERPDTLSYELYETVDHYWTFFLLNDHIRESGWPIADNELLDYAKLRWPNRVTVTEVDFAKTFPVGSVVTGQTSGTVGTIVKRNLDLGQLVIDTVDGNNYGDNEIISYMEEDGSNITMRLVKESTQYNSVHHYEDANGVWTDINPHDDATPSGLIPITNLNRLENRNEELKEIIVLKPEALATVTGEFNKLMKQRRR